MIQFSNVVVYNYQYLLDPKVSGIISRELERECIVVFDEAHNIDNVCIEALSVNIRQQTLDGAARNIAKLNTVIERCGARGDCHSACSPAGSSCLTKVVDPGRHTTGCLALVALAKAICDTLLVVLDIADSRPLMQTGSRESTGAL